MTNPWEPSPLGQMLLAHLRAHPTAESWHEVGEIIPAILSRPYDADFDESSLESHLVDLSIVASLPHYQDTVHDLLCGWRLRSEQQVGAAGAHGGRAQAGRS